MSSAGAGISARGATLRAIAAECSSPERSQASATNEAPAAMPPNQKYSGTSQVQTGAFIIGPCTMVGGTPPPPRPWASAPRPVGLGDPLGIGRGVGAVARAGPEDARPCRVAPVALVQADRRVGFGA